jgi:3-oxoacyl-[acyl-carrier-protein] synthase III
MGYDHPKINSNCPTPRRPQVCVMKIFPAKSTGSVSARYNVAPLRDQGRLWRVWVLAMLSFKHVCLEALAYVLPEHVVTSLEIERELAPVYQQFGVHEGRLELMTGIRERRFWDEATLPSDASTRAGQRAIDASGVKPDQIECLIHTSVSRDFLEPATASVVHDNLSLPANSIMYDISNACLGFMNGMISLANMIEMGQVRRGLIVAGESSRQLVHTTISQLLKATKLTRQEFKTAFASLTIGSGAVALVMAHDSVAQTDHRLLGGVVRTATEHNHLCRGSRDTGFGADATMSMRTDAETLMVGGCALAAETWKAFKDALQWSDDDVGRAYCHQVGAAHRDKFYESIGLDPEKDFSTFEFLGNVGSVSLPLTMAMGIEREPPAPGERIAMLGIGSGLSSVMLGVRW